MLALSGYYRLELELEVASRAAVIGLPLSDGCYHYRDCLARLALSDGGYHYRATIGLELEVEVATIGLQLSDGCYHYRDCRACAE